MPAPLDFITCHRAKKISISFAKQTIIYSPTLPAEAASIIMLSVLFVSYIQLATRSDTATTASIKEITL